MFWPPHDDHPHRYYPYDEPFRLHDHERLRHLVFLDGRLVDAWTEPVERTTYQSLADELDREKRVQHHEPPAPMPPPHERVLTWLDGVVGGRVALLALDDEPLRQAPTIDDDDISPLLERVAGELFHAEFLVATRAALATVSRDDPDMLQQAPAGEIAAGLCWLVGRANGLVGAGTKVTQTVLKRSLWLSSSPTRRVPRLKSSLRGLVSEPHGRPAECPDLIELGDPAYLTGATRRRLIALRDRALAAAEREEADRHAREALVPGSVDSLRP